MKQFLLALFLLFSVFVKAQDSTLNSTLSIDTSRDEFGKFQISAIIKLRDSSVSKEKVFETLKEAIYKNFGSGNAVVQYENKEEGKIYGRANTSKLVYTNVLAKMDGGRFEYEINIICKQGKAKIILSNIIHKKGEMIQMRDGSDFGDSFPSTWGKFGKKQSQNEWIKMKEQAYTEFEGIFYLFYNSLNKVGADKGSDF